MATPDNPNSGKKTRNPHDERIRRPDPDEPLRVLGQVATWAGILLILGLVVFAMLALMNSGR